MTIFNIGFWEVRWMWAHWKTWAFDHVEYDGGGGIYVFYLGCLCIAKNYMNDTQ